MFKPDSDGIVHNIDQIQSIGYHHESVMSLFKLKVKEFKSTVPLRKSFSRVLKGGRKVRSLELL